MTMPVQIDLPIDKIRQDIVNCLKNQSRLILISSPGSGKSTRVPRFIVEDLKPEGKVVVLQPRRAAAMMLAQRVCYETQTDLKFFTGYQVKGDSQVSAQTKIIYMTPGIFLRRNLSQEFLKSLSCVILDEIHERSLEIDLCLALVLHWQRERSPELKCVAMSATLDEVQLQNVFRAEVIKCSTKPHPLEVVYHSNSLLDAIRLFLKKYPEPTSHLLIFESGKHEIQQVLSELTQHGFDESCECCALYGEMSLKEQQKVLSSSNKRKIIVATNIAETSLTIAGVSGVIDTGQCKLQRKDVATGANQLVKEWISKDRAEQRAGRAARTGAGMAIRLWSRQQQAGLRLATDPEISRCDLSTFILWLSCYEIPIEKASLLTIPAGGALEKCRHDLMKLGMMDSSYRLSPLGEQSLQLPLQPKYCKSLLESKQNIHDTILKVILYLENQLPLSMVKESRLSQPFTNLMDELNNCQHPILTHELKRLREQLVAATASSSKNDTDCLDWPLSLIRAMPENLCFSLPSEPKRFRILGGGTGRLETDDFNGLPKILWAATIYFPSKNLQNAFLRWYIPIEEEELLSLFKDSLSHKENLAWNEKSNTMTSTAERCFLNKVTLDTKINTVAFEPKYIGQIASMILNKQIILPTWENTVTPWLLRYHAFKKHFESMNLLAFNHDDLQIIVEEALSRLNSWKGLEQINWIDHFNSALSWHDLSCFEKNFPEFYTLTKGRKVRIHYSETNPPKISSKLQDYYDQSPHPTIGSGKVKLVCEILAPNQRPVQTTDDILGFWERSYPQIRKDLYRRYPKHEWR